MSDDVDEEDEADEEDEEDEDEEDELDEDDEDEEADEEPLFGKVEAATLLAVEHANGGELAELDQVVASYHLMFGRWPETTEFTEACGLLCEANLVEWQGRALGLTPKGRKFLRRTGRPGAPRRPKLVTDLLQGIEEKDLADEGSVPEPSEEDVARVIKTMTDNPYLAEEFQTGPGVNYSFIGLAAYGAQIPNLNPPPMVELGEDDTDDTYGDDYGDEDGDDSGDDSGDEDGDEDEPGDAPT